MWSKTPMHVLRQKCLEEFIDNLQPGCFVEFGAGTGDFTRLFLEKGFWGKCYDISKQTRIILKDNLQKFKCVHVVDDLKNLELDHFDYLLAFEVLEHIEQDKDALATWSRYLKPSGILLLSVPAHMKKYSNNDVSVGHIRRYEKTDLYNLLRCSGFSDVVIYNYGFPLGNITGYVRNMFNLLNKYDNLTFQERSVKSGIERNSVINKLSFFSNELFLWPFIKLQELFYNLDLGDGFVVLAKKSSSGYTDAYLNSV